MSFNEDYPFVDKLWDGEEVVMHRAKDAKKTSDELKSRISRIVTIEKNNAQNFLSCGKKFNSLPESGGLQKIWRGFESIVKLFSANAQSLSETLADIPNIINEECNLFVSSLEQNDSEYTPQKDKKKKDLLEVQSTRTQYAEAFKEWDLAEEDYERAVSERKSEEEKDMARTLKEEKKVVVDDKLRMYENAVRECRKSQEAYVNKMEVFLKASQEAENKRLQGILKVLSSICVAYKDMFSKNKELIDGAYTSLQKMDVLDEINAFASSNTTNRKPRNPVTVTYCVRRSEKSGHVKPAVEPPPTLSPSPPSPLPPIASSSSSTSTSTPSPVSPLSSAETKFLKHSYIPASHPLILFAAFNYTPEPPENPDEPTLDSNDQPLDKDFQDIPLQENGAYLLQRNDYPWDEWCSILPLQPADSEEVDAYFAVKGGVREELFYLSAQTSTRGGYAPANYFTAEYADPAKAHLLSNPSSLSDTIAQLTATPLAFSAPPPREATASSSSSSSSSSAASSASAPAAVPAAVANVSVAASAAPETVSPVPPTEALAPALSKLKHNYIQATHPLIVYAMYDYNPAPPDDPDEPVLDSNDQPLDKEFKDMELKENGAYLLQRNDYPWDEWCSVIPLQPAEAEEVDAYWLQKGGDVREELFFLDNPQLAAHGGGYAPANYFNTEHADPAKAHLLAHPDSAAKTVAFLTASPDAPKPVALLPLLLMAVSSSVSSAGGTASTTKTPPLPQKAEALMMSQSSPPSTPPPPSPSLADDEEDGAAPAPLSPSKQLEKEKEESEKEEKKEKKKDKDKEKKHKDKEGKEKKHKDKDKEGKESKKHKDKDKEGKEKKHKDKDKDKDKKENKKKRSYTALFPYTDENGANVTAGGVLYVPDDAEDFNPDEEWLFLEDPKGDQYYFPASYLQKNF